MARLYYTLECAGVEKSLADWKLVKCTLECTNQAGDSFGCDVQAGFSFPSIFDWGVEVKLWVGRERSDDGTYSGGTLFWIGYRAKELRFASPKMQRLQYKFQGIWEFWFDQMQYEQKSQSWDNSIPGYVDVWHSHVTLGQDDTGAQITVGQQVTNILSLLTDRMAADPLAGEAKFTSGGGFPAFKIPYDTAANITCGQALRRLISWFGSTSIWFDYSTSPPTLYCKTRDQLEAVSLPAKGSPGEQIQFTRRDDLVPRAVHFVYRITVQEPAATYQALRDDIACDAGYVDASGNPNGTTWATLKAASKLFGVNKKTFDFQGPKISQEKAYIEVQPFAPNTLAWWQSKCPELAAKLTDGTTPAFVGGTITINGVTVTTSDSATALGYEILDGTWSPWMDSSAGYQEAEVVGRFSAQPITEDGRVIETWLNKEFHAKVRLTTIATTGYFFQTPSVLPGEDIPFGLAKTIFDLDSVAQYDGSYRLRERHITGRLRIGQVLNVTKALEEYTTMRAQVQIVEYDFESNATTSKVGVAKHLGEGDLIAKANAARGPRNFFLFGDKRQFTGSEGLNSIESAKGVPKENSMPGRRLSSEQAWYESSSASAGACVARVSAVTQELSISSPKPAVGQPQTRYGSFNPKLSDLDAITTLDATNEAKKREVKFREMAVYDLDGTRWYLAHPTSDKYHKTADDGVLARIPPCWI